MNIHKKQFTFIPTGERCQSVEFDTEEECKAYDKKIGKRRKSIYKSADKYYITEVLSKEVRE